MFLSPRKTLTKCSTPTDDFNERRLLAKSFAVLEEHTYNSKSFEEDATSRVLAHRRRSVLTIWHLMASRRNTERYVNAEKAAINGKRLTLLTAIRSWRSGAKICQKERELNLKEHDLNLMIESKWEAWGLCRSRIG
jgi:hypothetical protein